MSYPFLGEIRIFAFNYAPQGWAFCDGQTLIIAQNQALYSLLGVTYGGNGITTFCLPDLRGRAPFHLTSGFIQGAQGGEESHTLTAQEMPTHTHTAIANSTGANQSSPQNAVWANSGRSLFSGTANATLYPGAGGGSQAHENRSPYLVMNFCIAISGIFPTRS